MSVTQAAAAKYITVSGQPGQRENSRILGMGTYSHRISSSFQNFLSPVLVVLLVYRQMCVYKKSVSSFFCPLEFFHPPAKKEIWQVGICRHMYPWPQSKQSIKGGDSAED